MIVDEAAIAVRNLVELPDGRQAEMREVVTEFLEVLRFSSLSISWSRRSGRRAIAGEFYNILLLFAVESMIRRASASRLKRLCSTWAEEAARLVHIPRRPIVVIRLRRPVTT
jgi:hypothetical protein